ncbi:hypothetical protein [Flexivirga caeni]|uniref:Alpha/beta hydrolase n=1 Tax=Flexivirga caeni TaxID=2294115 RepID=A0A3M9LV75_9MICO|nr:hypothetical protein [Flexivirga caeni]RNI17201.1 hypothetical protein EFY87_19600 [Flexivirga caeni]
MEDLVALASSCQFLVIAGAEDTWSRGAAELDATCSDRGLTNLTVEVRPGTHAFPEDDRGRAYAFLDRHLW